MKKLIIILALAMPMLVNAQKLGYINSNELFDQMPEKLKIKLQLDTLQMQYENELSLMKEEFQKKLQDYQSQAATMTDAIRQVREGELANLDQRIQGFYQTAGEEITRKHQELVAPVQQRMLKAINDVGEKEGYTYIFDSSVMLYIAPTAENVMPSVKKELNIK